MLFPPFSAHTSSLPPLLQYIMSVCCLGPQAASPPSFHSPRVSALLHEIPISLQAEHSCFFPQSQLYRDGQTVVHKSTQLSKLHFALRSEKELLSIFFKSAHSFSLTHYTMLRRLSSCGSCLSLSWVESENIHKTHTPCPATLLIN